MSANSNKSEYEERTPVFSLSCHWSGTFSVGYLEALTGPNCAAKYHSASIDLKIGWHKIDS